MKALLKINDLELTRVAQQLTITKSGYAIEAFHQDEFIFAITRFLHYVANRNIQSKSIENVINYFQPELFQQNRGE